VVAVAPELAVPLDVRNKFITSVELNNVSSPFQSDTINSRTGSLASLGRDDEVAIKKVMIDSRSAMSPGGNTVFLSMHSWSGIIVHPPGPG